MNKLNGTHLVIMFVTGAAIGAASLLFASSPEAMAAGTGLAGTIVGGVLGVVKQGSD
jgi:hypothetical protein